jgi:hypothetical protein
LHVVFGTGGTEGKFRASRRNAKKIEGPLRPPQSEGRGRFSSGAGNPNLNWKVPKPLIPPPGLFFLQLFLYKLYWKTSSSRDIYL